MSKPLGIIFHCPGVDHAGCPDKANTALVMQTGRWSGGLSVKVLLKAFDRDGWTLGTMKVTHQTGEIDAVDPLCPKCGAQLRQELKSQASEK